MSEFRVQQRLMGSAFELIIIDDDASKAKDMLQKGMDEIRRIEAMLTEFDPSSFTCLLNKDSGVRALEVPDEMYRLIQRSLHLTALTQGAFDITVKPLKTLYDFRKRMLELPATNLLKETLGRVGSSLIKLGKNNRVYLSRRGMALSFASIGKGYAADRVRELWRAGGVSNGVINASGDLSILGRKSDGSPWKIGIADPGDPSDTLLNIPLEKGSVATSGDYEQYFIHEGKRYSHTIDPATGIPVTGIKSVTVTGISAELCDALATAVTVMGVDAGLFFINQLPGTHCLIIDDKNKLHFSKNIIFEKTR